MQITGATNTRYWFEMEFYGRESFTPAFGAEKLRAPETSAWGEPFGWTWSFFAHSAGSQAYLDDDPRNEFAPMMSMQGRSTRPNPLGALTAAHDAITFVGFVVAVVCLAVIVCSYCYEVVARYAFSAPTMWAGSLVSYALCGMLFLALPELTRTQAHISITILSEMTSPRNALALQRVIRVVSAAACMIAAWFSIDATLNQYHQGIQTISEWPVVKWPLSLVIAYGWLSSGLYFFRQIVSGLPEGPAPAAMP